MKNLASIKNEYNKLSESARIELLNKLRAKYLNTDLTKDVDIISDASLPFLMVVDAIEELPRKGNKHRPALALDFLAAQSIEELSWLGIDYQEAKPGVLTYTISYLNIGKYLENKDIVNKNLWRGIYLIINAIFVKEDRYVGAWFDTIKIFYSNFLSESYLVATIPGLKFNNAGVRHDMLCATSGTSDPDFIYVENNVAYTAEFKLPTKTVGALAAYGYKNTGYIYNAKILFTYDVDSSQFYKINYTIPDYYLGKSYTICALGITGDSARIFNS